MEILTKVFEIEPGKVDRRSQMRVANILTNLSWKKAGQKQHQGKRQVVWKRAIPLLNEESIALLKDTASHKVLQPENKIEQGLSIPTTPSIPNNKTVNKENNRGENSSINNDGVSYNKGIANIAKQDKTKDTACHTSQRTLATPVSNSINWLSYPYNSKDVQTLKNRANKVKQRVFGCATSNELNQLLFSRFATEVELDWLVKNYLSESEISQLRQIQAFTQTNLFSEPHPIAEIIKYEFDEIKDDIDAHMQRVGWSVQQGRQYLIDTYGKKSRVHLTDEELLEFWEYLKNV